MEVHDLRLVFFLGTLAAMGILEHAFPRRPRSQPQFPRWLANLSMVGLGAAFVRWLLPLAPLAVADFARRMGWGIFPRVSLPYALAFLLSVIALDVVVYVQHVLSHAVPTLWRFHMVHHADLDIDTTTGVRFHPVEIYFSALLKSAAVVVIGPPVKAVLVFEIVLNTTALFNHANLFLPPRLDRFLRWILVTPDMHRVHHSVIIKETNSNFGFALSWWDRLMGTYKKEPERGHEGMTIGLSQFRDPSDLSFHRLLILPLVGDPGRQAINRH